MLDKLKTIVRNLLYNGIITCISCYENSDLIEFKFGDRYLYLWINNKESKVNLQCNSLNKVIDLTPKENEEFHNRLEEIINQFEIDCINELVELTQS